MKSTRLSLYALFAASLAPLAASAGESYPSRKTPA